MSQERDNKGGKRLLEKKPRERKPREKKPAPQGQKPPSGENRRNVILRRVYIAVTIVAAIIVAVYVAWSLFSAPPEVVGPSGVVGAVTRPPQTTTTVDPQTGKEIEVEIPGLSADRKNQFYTFLIVGQDTGGGGNTDTMILAAYDVPNQKLSLMSLPRDTYVDYGNRSVLLNSIYNRGGGAKDGKGIAALEQEVSDLTGVYPDFHIIVQWDAVGELVNAIDGVDFEVPFDMYYNDLSQGFKIDLKKGYQHLNGSQAMQLIRYRHNSIGDTGVIDKHYGYAEGDIGRIKTQQAFLKAIIAKCLKMDVLITNLPEYIAIFQKNVVTDLTASNLAYFAKSAAGGLQMDNVAFTTLPYKSAGDAHLLPIGNEIVKTVNGGFNPYKEDIRLGELRLTTKTVVTATTAPSASETPEGNDTPAPNESAAPTESDVLLPPGVTAPPSAPGTSSAPPSTPPPASQTPVTPPPASQAPASPPPANTPEPVPEPTPVPTPPPAASPDPDEPLLPPGVEG